MDIATFGEFPFGRPNTARPMRRPATEPAVLVVGVYPSAFHVAWSPPPEFDDRAPTARRRPRVASLAVDVEPTVFWDGQEPQPAQLLAQWRHDVGFDDERHGTVSVGTNGPSGAGLVDGVLDPLGISPAAAAFTDVVPWFFVKHGAKSQGDAIEQRFNPLAAKLGVSPGALPQRPTHRALVALAASEARRDSLRRELLDAQAPLVITLGQEALDAIRAIVDHHSGTQTRLAPDGYGERGEINVDGRRAALLPLVHPGFQRQTTDARWTSALARWQDTTRSTR